MRCVLVFNGDSDWDWWTIERAEHQQKEWVEPVPGAGAGAFRFMHSGRISDACVEGPSHEMLALAEAIEKRKSEGFRRCAVTYRIGASNPRVDTFALSSPRNSTEPGILTIEEADELAANIRETLKDYRPPKVDEPEPAPVKTTITTLTTTLAAKEEWVRRKVNAREKLLEDLKVFDLKMHQKRMTMVGELQALDAAIVGGKKDFDEAKAELAKALEPCEAVEVKEGMYEYKYSLSEETVGEQ